MIQSFETSYKRKFEVFDGEYLKVTDTRLGTNIQTSLRKEEALKLMVMLSKEFEISSEEFEKGLKPEKFYYKLPEGLYDSFAWLSTLVSEQPEYDDRYRAESFSDDEFNELLERYPALKVLEKYTRDEWSEF